MIRFENVSKAYSGEEAVSGLNFEIPGGELTVLIGPSGCGKTTTLKMINRLIEPTSGTVFINGQNVAGLDPQELRRGIGYVIQSVGLFPHLTVRQNIQVVPDLLGWSRKKSSARADELLALIGLEPGEYRDRYPRQLSGGQQQRVGVARALAVDPPVLLMDEPFGAVDPLTRDHLQDEFLELQQRLRKTVVMVTHDMGEAIKLADRICLMNDGRIEQYDTPEVLLSAPANRFVRRFVGSDRALKRLSRIRVGEVLEPVQHLELATPEAEAEAELRKHSSLFVTEDGKLIGWLVRRAFRSAGSVEAAYNPLERRDALDTADDVRDALAMMLEQGVVILPVVDAAGQLIGQVSLAQVVTLTAPDDAEGNGGPA
jgi:osmoprotectant transport system ATP-binding protein